MIGLGGYSGEYLDSRTARQLNLLLKRLTDSLENGPRGHFLRAGIRF